MMLTPLQKRAARKNRNKQQLDLNLVSLIDIFTILIFFLLSSASEVETLPSFKAVKLPESTADTQPKETIVVVISANEIVVDGRKVADVADVMKTDGDMIAPLKAELLSASISIAMNNTAFALMVAIPFLLMHAFLQARTAEIVDGLEAAKISFLNMVQRLKSETAPAAR